MSNRNLGDEAEADLSLDATTGRPEEQKEPANCPLVTGRIPCMCDIPRCPACGYTEHDARFHLDHGLCREKNPPWRRRS